jgi:hypothetical protein
MTWRGSTGIDNVQFFINGVSAGGGGTLVAPIDAMVGNVTVDCNMPGHGYLDEVRVWAEDRAGTLYEDGTDVGVSDIIKNSMNAPRDLTGTMDVNLIAYLKFADLTDSISGDILVVAGTTAEGGLITTDGAPLRYGASFVCNQFSCTVGQNSSIIYPIRDVPDDVDFMLCVAWEDDSGNTQRRRLWDMDGVDINPMPAAYRGETLPTTFFLEVWNIDGNATATLSETITIYSSITSDPVDATDRTNTSLLTPTQSSALADPFPMGFPSSFDTQQTY